MEVMLWDLPCRKTALLTSAVAALEITESGRRRGHCEQIMAHLVAGNIVTPESAVTHTELARRMGWEAAKVHKRMADCQRKGPWRIDGRPWTLRAGPARRCHIRGTLCLTYTVQPA